MLLDVNEVMLLGYSESQATRKVKALESAIHKYTHNSFRFKEVKCDIINGELHGAQFDNNTSIIVNGLLCNVEVTDGVASIDEPIDYKGAIVIVKYPYDVIEGAYKLLEYEKKNQDKLGIASESIGRHSVTYKSSENILGYPNDLVTFLKPYRKART